jgi:hypothetical protein
MASTAHARVALSIRALPEVGMDVRGRIPVARVWPWVAAIAALWCWSTCTAWPYLLDDTYIHLRYAWNLGAGAGYAFNVGEPSGGTSAPLYAELVARFGAWLPRAHWPSVAKTISVVASAAALLMIAALAWPATAPRLRPWWFVMLALVFATPASIRWLQDGMETGLMVFAAIACATAVDRWDARAPTVDRVVLLGVVAALPAIVRVDAAPITIATLLAARALDRRAWGPAALTSVVVVASSWAMIWLTVGSLVPDAAIAKARGFSLTWPLHFASALATVSPWWALAAVVLLVRAVRHERLRSIALLGLLPLAAIAGAGWLRGQDIPGARYGLAPLAFAWGMVLVLERRTGWIARAIELPRVRKGLLALTMVGCAHVALTWPALRAMFEGTRIDVPDDLRVPGTRVLAYDVGLLSWEAPIVTMDLAGLVNGHAIARLTPGERPCALARLHGPAERLVLRDERPELILPPTPGVIEYGDREITITCDETGPITYVPTDHVLMVNKKLRDSPHWRMWRPRGRR